MYALLRVGNLMCHVLISSELTKDGSTKQSYDANIQTFFLVSASVLNNSS
jgi:hypothetical protein